MFTFIETKLFTRLVKEYLTDGQYSELQVFLVEKPDAGTVIPESGAVRKLRWGSGSRGKRSGYRVIYFPKIDQHVIWMLTMYAKNVVDNIPANVLRRIRRELEND